MIKDLTEAKLQRSEQPLLFLRMHVARYLLVLGQTKECKAAIEDGKQTLDSMGDVSLTLSPLSICCAESIKSAHCELRLG